MTQLIVRIDLTQMTENKLNKCPKYLIISEMEINTTLMLHLT